MAATKLSIRNSSPYPRGGHVEIPWDQAGEWEVTIGGDDYPAQADAVNGPGNPLVLSFTVPSLPPGTHKASVRRRSVQPQGPFPGAGARQGGVYLVNRWLDIWFSLSNQYLGHHFFAAAAPTVQIQKFEFLDTDSANKNRFEGHDPEKRAMQLDYVRIWRPPWDHYEPPYCDFPLFNQPWTLLASGSGPVRAWATMVSPKFVFDFRALEGERRSSYNCYLYRTLSLFADAHYVMEDLRVSGTPAAGGAGVEFAFAANYYMSAELSIDPKIVHIPAIPDWFGIAPNWGGVPKSPGYGFATDAHVTVVRNPPPGFPRPEDEEHKAFSWSTEAARHIRSLHCFRLETNPAAIADEAGKLWYMHLLEPLRGE